MRNKLMFCLFFIFLGSGCTTLPKPSITAIQNAENLLEQNQMLQAEQLLDKYHETWKTQAIRGNIALNREQWQIAALFFQKSLNLAKTIHPEPSYEEKERIYSSFEDAQLLAGETVGALIVPPLDPRSKSMGIRPKIRLAVEFKSGRWEIDDITSKGKTAVRMMADYLSKTSAKGATIIGHTDERGKASYNQKLSEKRAESVKAYLKIISDIPTQIKTIGKGEDEPLRPLPRWKKNWTQEQIYRRDRRVELVVK